MDPRWAAPQRFIATMGMPVDEQGVNQGENLNTACRNAVLGMIALLHVILRTPRAAPRSA
jgi:hypothetical protein